MLVDPVFLLAAFLTGLAGAGHCAGMCGGLAGALAQAGKPGMTTRRTLAYSGGRLTTYTLLGLLAGSLSALATPADTGVAMLVGRSLTALVFFIVALHLLGILGTLRVFESAGARIWRLIMPLLRRLVPVDTLPRAWALGMLWGLMPCGLVYGALLYAATSGSSAGGALTLLAFGAGTLPAVIGLGLAGRWLADRAAGLRLGSGLLMLLYAFWTLASTAIALPQILSGECRSPGDILGVVLNTLIHVN